jgi:hypothetical protein
VRLVESILFCLIRSFSGMARSRLLAADPVPIRLPDLFFSRDKKALEEKAAKKAQQAAAGGTGTSTDNNKNKAGGKK